jgi:hypothetical protein
MRERTGPRCIGTLLTLLTLLLHARASAADPTTADCLSANEKAISLRNQHALRAARSELLVCAAPNCPEDVRNECARRVTEVNAQMPTIVFEAKDHDGNDLSSVVVSMDGQPLVGRLEGTALSIDPGEHLFAFSADGAAPVERRLVIREAEKGRRERIVLGEAPAAPAPVAPPAAELAPLAPEPLEPQPIRPVESHATQRTIGIIVGAVGVASLGVALVEQITAHSRFSDSRRLAQSLDPDIGAMTHGKYQDAKSAQTLSIVFGAVGVAALGTGLVLLLTGLDESGSRETRASNQRIVPVFGPSGAAVTYLRAF